MAGKAFDQGVIKPGSAEPAAHLLIRKAKPGMGIAVTQCLKIMAGKIDNEQASPRGKNTGEFANRGFGCGQIMQHLMEDDSISASVLKRQGTDIALAQLNRRAVKLGTGKAKHFRAAVNTAGMACPPGKEREHPASACANINQPANGCA